MFISDALFWWLVAWEYSRYCATPPSLAATSLRSWQVFGCVFSFVGRKQEPCGSWSKGIYWSILYMYVLWVNLFRIWKFSDNVCLYFSFSHGHYQHRKQNSLLNWLWIFQLKNDIITFDVLVHLKCLSIDFEVEPSKISLTLGKFIFAKLSRNWKNPDLKLK